MASPSTLLLIPLLALAGTSQHGLYTSSDHDKTTATVEVIAYDTTGHFVGPPNVEEFESFEHTDWAGRFHKGLAKNIPYGEYQLEARVTAYFSERRYVTIAQPRVTVVVGLTIGNELPAFPPTLRGRVTSAAQTSFERAFVKLIGVFSNLSIESKIDRQGVFQISGASPGMYLLMVINESGIVASRVVNAPDIHPIEIDIRHDHAVCNE